MESDRIFMARCLELAEKGAGMTFPNPMVGCVVVDQEGNIIGEGYHHQYGGAHAEVIAINSIRDTHLISESTLYVTLEPCSHHGKTPPCADLIISQGFRRVVVGATDSNPRVSGAGISKLRAAGIEVKTGLLEEECRFVNREFFTYHEYQRPYVILKWARTQDGFIDQERSGGSSPTIHWITDGKLKMLVHRWRSESSAILAGAVTIVNDNPELTTREWPGNNPLRVVIDFEGVIDDTFLHKVFSSEAPTWLYTPNNFSDAGSVNLMALPDQRDKTIGQVLHDLHRHRILSLIVEGGRQILDAFIESELWDEARVFTGNKRFIRGLAAPELPSSCCPTATHLIGEDQLEVFYNRKSSRL
jgi:diaminohydroxyphosphoribosylaminopyrimidine deaminase / 5-amino-6-(5-phosphoribosylamino)uracil reductase